MPSTPRQPSNTIPPKTASSLWSGFAKATDAKEYARYWLAIQCDRIPEAKQGLVALRSDDGDGFMPIAIWPDGGGDPERLAEITDRVIEERCGLLAEMSEASHPVTHPAYGIAYPILVDERLHGVVALEVQAVSNETLKYSMEQLQWGVSWMELFFRRQQSEEIRESVTRLESALDLLAGVLSENDFESACMAFVTELATRLDCDRVSLAFLHKNHARIQAVSHSAQIGDRMNLVRSIGLAMDEAIVQRKELLYPPLSDGEVLIVREHEHLAVQHGAGSILTLPFFGEEKVYGALTFERPPGKSFSREEVRFCRSVAALMFPVLDIRRSENRPLIAKIADSIKGEIAKVFGPRHMGRKAAVCLIVFLLGFFSLKAADYKISSDAMLEGAVKRAVVAPFDGYIKEANVRAGDLVEERDLMCLLDDRELRLQRLNWLSKRNQYRHQYQEALASHQRAEAKIIKAQLEQAAARLQLVENMLDRTRIESPFTGITLSGDLSQRLGGAVSKGDVLFEVAPLDEYRIILEVDERRIADVKVGQRGRLVLSALPRENHDFVVAKITPIAVAKEGLNYFRVEATPETISDRLRPGMEGVGKISVDRRKLISIWTRDLREWVQLWVWSWFP